MVNSPLITGKMMMANDSPLISRSALRKSINKNDLSFLDKSAYLGKYGFLKQTHINEISLNLNCASAGLNNSHNQSFQTESPPDSSPLKECPEIHLKSPSKFSISKKHNKVIQLNIPDQQCKTEKDENEMSDEEKKEEDVAEVKHKRNYSVAGNSGAGASIFKKHEENKKKEDTSIKAPDFNSTNLIPETEK